MIPIEKIAAIVGGELINSASYDASDLCVGISGVSIDSRRSCQGQLFIALPGNNFDGHDYLEQACQQGAIACIVEKETSSLLPSILVADAYQALTKLAAWWRSQFELPVIGLTGSVGKTTVKEMLNCIFSRKATGLVTNGNLNNEIGVPLTLLRLKKADSFAIIEMGMNHKGEISRLSNLSKPSVALINNAAAAHLEGLGSVAGVAQAKAEIFDGLSRDGIGIINADDEHASYWQNALLNSPINTSQSSQENTMSRKLVTFGLDHAADVSANYTLSASGVVIDVTTPNEQYNVVLNALGKHSVMNALAAIAVAYASGISSKAIIEGLAAYQGVAGRLNVTTLNTQYGSLTLIDDTYNANPASMRAAIEVLGAYPRSTLIVGDMGELGDSAEQAHLEIGRLASQHGIGRVLSVGQWRKQVIQHFDGESCAFTTQDALFIYLQDLVNNTTDGLGTVLVKGSRIAKMEKVVDKISSLYAQNGSNQTFDKQERTAQC